MHVCKRARRQHVPRLHSSMAACCVKQAYTRARRSSACPTTAQQHGCVSRQASVYTGTPFVSTCRDRTPVGGARQCVESEHARQHAPANQRKACQVSALSHSTPRLHIGQAPDFGRREARRGGIDARCNSGVRGRREGGKGNGNGTNVAHRCRAVQPSMMQKHSVQLRNERGSIREGRARIEGEGRGDRREEGRKSEKK